MRFDREQGWELWQSAPLVLADYLEDCGVDYWLPELSVRPQWQELWELGRMQPFTYTSYADLALRGVWRSGVDPFGRDRDWVLELLTLPAPRPFVCRHERLGWRRVSAVLCSYAGPWLNASASQFIARSWGTEALWANLAERLEPA